MAEEGARPAVVVPPALNLVGAPIHGCHICRGNLASECYESRLSGVSGRAGKWLRFASRMRG